MRRTVPRLPKSIITVVWLPAPSTLLTVPRPYLSWLTRSPTASSRGLPLRSVTFFLAFAAAPLPAGLPGRKPVELPPDAPPDPLQVELKPDPARPAQKVRPS